MTRHAAMWFLRSKWTAHHLPKRLELLLYTVFALPNASSTIPLSKHFSVIAPLEPEISARHDIAIFVVSVFPAPDSPEIRIDCAFRVRTIPAKAAVAIRKTCGGRSSSSSSLRDANVSPEHTRTGLYGLTTMSTGPIAVKMSSRAYRSRSVCSIVASLTSSSATRSSPGTASSPVARLSFENASSEITSFLSTPGGACSRVSCTSEPERSVTVASVHASASSTWSHTCWAPAPATA